jgi:uracil-DNA glycosylase family 4
MIEVKRPITKGQLKLHNLEDKNRVIKPFFSLGNLAKTPGEPNCSACKLHLKVKHPKMNFTGEGKLKALVIGEAPGETEDNLGIQFMGQSGSLYRKALSSFGLDLDRDFWKINAINCRPMTSTGSNRPPTPKEIDYCRPLWKAVIKQLNPRFIFLVGGKAIESFYGDRKWPGFKPFSIGRYRRLCIPDPDTNAWILPIIHPSYFIRNSDAEELFSLDLKWAISCLNKSPFTFENEGNKVTVVSHFDHAVSLLKSLKGITGPKAIDYECNCLRPYWDNSLLLTMAVSYTGQQAYAFPYEYPGHWTAEQRERIKELWIENVLQTGNLIAHSVPMEQSWNEAKFINTHDKWECDTLLRAHIIDTRDSYCNLNFQTYINFGVYKYDTEVSPYKNSKGKTHYNTMTKLPYSTIAKYNGQDAMFTRRLQPKQEKYIQRHLKKPDAFFKEGIINMTKLESKGVKIDVPYFQEQFKTLGDRLNSLDSAILNMPECKIFKKQKGKEIDLQSTADLRYLLFDIMGLQDKSKPTAKGTFLAVDAEVLNNIDTPFTNAVKEKRQVKKIQDYVSNLIFLADRNGRIHSSFNLHRAKTLRSSSNDPNFQNIPKHSEEAMKIIRTGIIPSSNRRFLATDYGSMEVRIWCCYTKDPVLTDYLNKDQDMHGEWGDFFEVSRYDAKNGFVFPLIYGSYYKSIFKEFVKRGYTHLTEEKVKAGEEKFWNKYHYSKEWLEKSIYYYNKTGKVETKFGFTFNGILSRNDIANWPIQSTAFHLLLWSLAKIEKIQSEEKWRSWMIAQIHDEILQDAVPNECDYIAQVTERIMVKETRERFDWIHIPLLAEFSMSDVNGSWAGMRKQNLIDGRLVEVKKEKKINDKSQNKENYYQ